MIATKSSSPGVVVLGAGSTGLGTGLGLALNGYQRDVLLIEKGARPGGLAGSYRWKTHTIDYGPHRLSPNIPAVRAIAEELLGPDCLTQKNWHGVQVGGKLYQFPPRVIDWITPRSLWHLASFGASFAWAHLAWIPWRFAPDTFESTLVRKFGRRFYDVIAEPMADKVWGDPAAIDPSFVNQRFAHVHPWHVLRRFVVPKQELNPSIYYYPRHGYQQLWDNMSDYLEREGQSVWLSSEPIRIEVEGRRIVRLVVRTPDGDTEIGGPDLTVVSTIPIATLVRLLQGVDSESLTDHVRGINVRSMLLVAFEFDLPQALPYRNLIYPQRDVCFNRLFEQNQYSRDTVAPGRSVVIADITYPRGDARLGKPDADVIEMVRADMAKLSYIPSHRIVDASVRRVEFAYVTPDLETRRRMYLLQHELKRIANLVLVGRFSAGEYDNADYAIDNGMTLGAMISGRTSKIDYLCRSHLNRQRYIVG